MIYKDTLMKNLREIVVVIYSLYFNLYVNYDLRIYQAVQMDK